MKTVNYDAKWESFLDSKEAGKVYFGVYIGKGRPQRLYPETTTELRECLSNVSQSALNPTLGSLYPAAIR